MTLALLILVLPTVSGSVFVGGLTVVDAMTPVFAYTSPEHVDVIVGVMIGVVAWALSPLGAFLYGRWAAPANRGFRWTLGVVSAVLTPAVLYISWVAFVAIYCRHVEGPCWA